MNLDVSAGALFGAAGAAVLHFLWQGVVIGVLAALVLRGCRREAAQARYCVALAGLGACAVVFVVTFVMQLAAHAPVGSGRGPVVVADGAAVAWWEWLLRTETVSAVWCLGVGVLTVRLCVQLAAARRLGRGVSVPPERWVEAFEGIKARLGVHKAVRLLQHASIDTPMVVGWLAPVVLVPAGAFMSLTPDQLYAVLAHELAHIRRKDHLLNGAQAVVEVVLFFHPVVWWLSSRARVEREHCCDDVAVGAAASPLVFAEALARLETLRHVFPQAAVAANGGSLMERIERVLKIGKAPGSKSLRWGGVAAIAAGAVVVAAALAQVSPQPSVAPAKPTVALKGNVMLMVKPTLVTGVKLDGPEATTVESVELEGLDGQPGEDVLFRIVEVQADRLEDDQGQTIEAPVRFRVKLTEKDGQPHELRLLRAAEAELQEMRKLADDLEAAVDAGQITREEADKKLEELKARTVERPFEGRVVELRLDGQDGAKTEAPAKDVVVVKGNRMQRIRLAETDRLELDKIADEVAAGTITRAEADERIQAVQKAAAERAARDGRAGREERAKRDASERDAKK